MSKFRLPRKAKKRYKMQFCERFGFDPKDIRYVYPNRKIKIRVEYEASEDDKEANED